jgi:hypothetical protein
LFCFFFLNSSDQRHNYFLSRNKGYGWVSFPTLVWSYSDGVEFPTCRKYFMLTSCQNFVYSWLFPVTFSAGFWVTWWRIDGLVVESMDFTHSLCVFCYCCYFPKRDLGVLAVPQRLEVLVALCFTPLPGFSCPLPLDTLAQKLNGRIPVLSPNSLLDQPIPLLITGLLKCSQPQTFLCWSELISCLFFLLSGRSL